MKLTFIVSSVLVLLLAIILGFRALNTFITPPVAVDEWWGPSEKSASNLTNVSDIEIKEMTPISFAEDALEDLRHRLTNARYFRSLEKTRWSYGSHVAELKKFARY